MIIVYIHTGIESVVYDEPIQASNAIITDNPSYGANERKNQGSKLKHYWTLHNIVLFVYRY